MSDAGLFVGADRAGGAWLAVAFTDTAFEEAAVFDEIGQLWQHYEETATRILLDVPIGLVESGDPIRPPDDLARSVLGPRSSTVFSPPVREATRKRRYDAAKRVNERKADVGLSKQAFQISDAIAAVDDLLQNVPAAPGIIAESHPEVCFRAFAGEPLQHSKRTAAGYAERLRTLATNDPAMPEVVQATAETTGGHEVAVHDVLDAVVLALTAKPGEGELRSLPADPPTDAKGLPMQIVYRSATPLQSD
ncbi:DUF429 domain-containing protein [Halobacteriales archaeon Cl-PHB]